MSQYPNIIGQEFVIERCLAIIDSQNQFNILLRGWWGMGKTRIAKMIPNLTMSLYTHTFQVAPLKSIFDPSKHVADVHIVDEAHKITDFESLYEWMETYNFIFTSNMASRIPEPFLSRCFVFRLRNYSLDQITEIIQLHTNLDQESAHLIAKRSRKVPRIAVNLGEKVEYILAKRGTAVRPSTVRSLMDELGIDERGLTPLDREYLEALETGPRSARELRAVLSIDPDELERMERYLLQLGEITITNKGRMLA